MRWPFVLRSTHERAIAKVQQVAVRTAADRDRYRQAHWNGCDCHDAWDKCPCASDGHPKDGSCSCCSLGTGICGPRPEVTP